MKRALLYSGHLLFLILAFGHTYSQPCPGDSVVLNSSTLPGLVLSDTIGTYIAVGSGTSSYITTAPNTTTTLTAYYLDDHPNDAAIFFNTNFLTDIGSSGVFSASIKVCGIEDVSTHSDSVNTAIPAPASPQLIVYPTVSTGMVTVTGNSAILGNADMLVVDGSGRTVYHLHNGGSTAVQLYLGQLANGIYFLRINNGSGPVTKKIIINK